MINFYIEIKIKAGGGTLGQQGAPPAIPLYGIHYFTSVYIIKVGIIAMDNRLHNTYTGLYKQKILA